MTLSYKAVYVPTGQVFDREAVFLSLNDFREKINYWNQTATCAPQVFWLYY